MVLSVRKGFPQLPKSWQSLENIAKHASRASAIREREGERELKQRSKMINKFLLYFHLIFELHWQLTIFLLMNIFLLFSSFSPTHTHNRETDTVTLRTANQRNCRYSNQVEIWLKRERRKFNKFRGSIAEKEEREQKEERREKVKRKSTRTHMSEFVVERRKATHKKYENENVAEKH